MGHAPATSVLRETTPPKRGRLTDSTRLVAKVLALAAAAREAVAVRTRAFVVDQIREGPRPTGILSHPSQDEPKGLHDAGRHRGARLRTVIKPVERADGPGHESATRIRVSHRRRLAVDR